MAEGQVSDEELRRAVLGALQADPATAGLGLRVGVLHGLVSLAGAAPAREIWRRAGQLAAGVRGVRGVANRIQAPGAPSPMRSIDLDLPRPGGRQP